MTNEQLVIRIQAGEKTADNMAQLYEQTKRFIHTIAKRYEGHADLDDLDQEGYLALYAAIDGYDPSRGCKFLTYAEHWIRQGMLRYIQNCCRTVRIPVHECEKLREYKKLVGAFQEYYGRKPSRREIAHNMGLPYKQVIELEKTARMAQIGSLDRVLSEDGEGTVGDLVPGDADVEGEVLAAADQELLQGTLWPLVDALPGNQGAVLRARFQDGKTLDATGELLGMTGGRVRTIQAEGLRGLGRSRNARLLRSFLPDDMEAQAYRHNGSGEFNRTWTSSTEWVAMRL